MEYERTKEGEIQAALAYRLGIILKQYYNSKVSENKYEVSLAIAILQNLLTNCIELTNRLSKKDKKNNPLTSKNFSYKDWGISEECIIKNTFSQGDLSIEKIFRHIRNALSHPTGLDLSSEFHSTGYTTSDTDPNIQKIILITSPDVKSNRLKIYNSYKDAEDWIKRQGTFPSDIQIVNKQEKFQFVLNEASFYRIFRIELTPIQLINLTFALSSYLSSPLLKEWTGTNFKIETIAA